jgi:ferric-dicitrate binding protein FerR (iron transport regulator)
MKMKRILQTLLVLLFSVQFVCAQSSNSLTATEKPVLVVLSDKSKILVNHAGTVTYPSVLEASQNSIGIKGEAYVEIKSKALKTIRTGDALIRGSKGAVVNINGFDSNSLTITAIKGDLTVTRGKDKYGLHAGEQMTIQSKQNISIEKADINEVISWTK